MRFITQQDLVSFGNYLLSEERAATIESKENKSKVHDCDVANWKEKEIQKEKK
ncbi:hypothetical protein [Dysgonomonas sp. 520]|uniref:hypothetical protein n=1 Tax=Dysgonomonas sp. 520 TaxID=2302931 RepID=UPI0013D831A0|nr:hypothetical protein [Dysgonomonas sp. 520]